MSDLDIFLAKTQARLAFFLIIILVFLCGGVIWILLKSQSVNPTVSNLLVQVVTGVLALCGTACGFFYARTRSGGIPDVTNLVTQKITAPDGTTTVVTSPSNAKPESVPTLATTSNTSPLAPKPENPV
jgi:hypothetical protein